MRLEHIDWPRAIDSVRVAREAQPRLPDVLSLAACHHDDAALAFAWLAEARRLAPLDPVVSLRTALAQVRFGETGLALASIETMPTAIKQTCAVMRAKIVANLHDGEPRRAANVANELLEQAPDETSVSFLSADAALRMGELKAAENRLTSAPRGPEHAASWTDALCKLLLARPNDTKFVVGQLARGAPPKGSPGAKLVERMLEWTRATDADLADTLESAPPGSPIEELLVILLVAKTRVAKQPLLPKLLELSRRWPTRQSVRRAHAAALTARAVEAAGAERWDEALRLVEICLRLEPHEKTHHQNRAALLTLTSDTDAALEAWAALDRHHQRLALAGRLTAADARSYARPHRMLADLSRLTPREPAGAQRLFGVFTVKENKRGEIVERRLLPNDAQIDSDPEQFRQWIHHRRAELVWNALASFPDVNAVLCHPSDGEDADQRISALSRMAGSFAVLVPDEGERLAERVAERFETCRGVTTTSYRNEPLPAGGEAAAARWVVETADAARLCCAWRPDPRRAGLVDELVVFLEDCAAFVDARALALANKATLDTAASAVRDLVAFARGRLSRDADVLEFDRAQWGTVVRALACQARLGLVERAYADGRIRGGKEIQEWIATLDRARSDDPTDPVIEFWGAQLTILGGFWDDARDAVRAFHRKAGSRPVPALADRIDKMRRFIETESAKTSDGARRAERHAAATAPAGEIAELEAAALADPTSITIYESLVHELAGAGRYADASEVCERALARCLGRHAQLRARKLSLELAGLAVLAAHDAPSARLYLAGTRAAAVDALMAVPTEARTYPLEYLTGIAALSVRDRDLAERAFVKALSNCTRPLHLAVLRPLAGSVERAAVDALRETIERLLDARRPREASEEVLRTMVAMREPELCVIDLARTELALALAELASPSRPLGPLSPPNLAAPWAAQLRHALGTVDRLASVDALAVLAAEVYEPSSKEGAAVRARVAEVRAQIGRTEALERSTQMLADGRADDALRAIEGADSDGADPRILRQRAMVLLSLGRFDEADAIVAGLEERKGDPTAEALVARWPEIRFRHQTAAAATRVRAKDLSGASAVLAKLVAPSARAEIELAYLRAFVLASQGYAEHKNGGRARARALFREALGVVEPVVERPEARAHTSLIELHARLDEDLEKLDEAHV